MTLTTARAAALGRALLLGASLLALLGGTAVRAHAAGSGDATVTFKLNATTDYGDTVLLAGSSPELGAWDTAKAVPLTTDARAYPTWSATVRITPGGSVQYKYLKRTAAGDLTWENTPNRSLTPPQGETALDDRWNVATGTPVATTFRAAATTTGDQNLFVVGNLAELGGWDPVKAVPLHTDAGTASWTGAAQLPPNTAVQYKYLKKGPGGTVIWEDGDNRTGVTPPTGTLTFADTWRETAPPCLSYSSDWRYTFVTNACTQPYSVQLAYVSGASSPCRYTEPGDMVTFAGYGTNADYVTRLRLC
ncbi:carbohydrate-binding module family 20 domain-containing protein [Kitasatospora sp. NPDC048365]|uniref:carbohydrate-binding module family 20 domain-containing protein n=1 Tax=Kitasatospora sp. NPDC048365 TaxID=3364050 RepID=UPI00371B5654